LTHKVFGQPFVSQLFSSRQFAKFLKPQLFFAIIFFVNTQLTFLHFGVSFVAFTWLRGFSHKNTWFKLTTC